MARVSRTSFRPTGVPGSALLSGRVLAMQRPDDFHAVDDRPASCENAKWRNCAVGQIGPPVGWSLTLRGPRLMTRSGPARIGRWLSRWWGRPRTR